MEAFVDMVKRLQGQGYTRDAAEAQASLSIMDQDLNSQVPQDTPPVVDQGTVPPAPPVNVSYAPQSAPAPQAAPTPTQASEAPVEAPTSSQSYSFDNSAYPGEVATPSPVGIPYAVKETRGEVELPDPNAFKYEVSPSSDGDAFLESILAFGLQTLITAANPNTQDWGQAIASGLGAGSNAFFGAMDRNKRVENIKALEDMGYNKTSINQYLKTGDNKVLSKDPINKRVWMDAPDENGMMRKQLIDEVTGRPVLDENGNATFINTGVREAKAPENKVVGNKLYAWNPTTGKWEQQVDASPSPSSGSAHGVGVYGGQEYEPGVHAIPQEDGTFKYIEVAQTASGKTTVKPSTEKKYQDYVGYKNEVGTKGDDGLYYVNDEKTGERRLVTVKDMPEDVLSTGDTRKATSFAMRAANAERAARQAMEDGLDPSAYAAGKLVGNSLFPEAWKAEDRQRFEAARREFANAVLRTDTGAAYSLLEQSDVDKLFPQPGDSAEVMAVKQELREEILEALAVASGGGARYVRGNTQTQLNKVKPKVSPGTKERFNEQKNASQSGAKVEKPGDDNTLSNGKSTSAYWTK